MADKREQDCTPESQDEACQNRFKESDEAKEHYDKRDESLDESFPASDPPPHSPSKENQ